MASPRISRTCAGALRGASRSVASNSRRQFHTPAPLYLDFLAPSSRPQSISTPRVPSKSPTKCLQQRSFTSSRCHNAKAIVNPRKDDSGNDMTITITPRAAHRLQKIAEKDGNPDLALRVAVESGGCHGFQYLMSLTNASEADPEEDIVFENEERVSKKEGEDDGYKAKVIMDEPSLDLLKGSSVDYTMELIGSQFKVTGIPGAKSSCGCGTSFDIAA
ncbi:Putative FeS cluster insertion protein [Septoria linicola]|uniref:FeS cluster insertion protein n=1 Tax=Septoria linicola TaxID=215465 RepID=A0A9Q9ATZ6_9PEZI|nr:putative FeS cluster insertion protein [Septoria linicola]USW55384.1 Putative FeS cluster insertion protein [Septoria linicola]